MAVVAIELVDAGLVAVREGAPPVLSPGVALLDPAGLLVGAEAAAAARLKPVFAFDRFWSQLSLDPLPRPVPGAHSPADLAHAQLRQLWSGIAGPGDEVVLAVPGSMDLRALGLAGGIARAAGIPVAGLVDAALAACAGLATRETVLHLDLQLHQAVLTELRGRSELARRRVEVAPRVGLRPLHSAWAQLVAEAMVRRTRFDPLHQAATEQQLFDRLPGWLARLGTSDAVEVELESGAGNFGVTLRREQFVFAVEAYYAQLLDLVHAARRAGEPVTLALSERAAALPGLAERCAGLADVELAVLPATAAASAALARAGEIRGSDGPVLVTSLVRTVAVQEAAAGTRPGRGEPPTHLVYGGRAQRIDAVPLVIGTEAAPGRALVLAGPAAGVSRAHCSVAREGEAVVVRDLSRYGTFVNGERIEGSMVLAAGDRLRVGTPGIVLELVAAG